MKISAKNRIISWSVVSLVLIAVLVAGAVCINSFNLNWNNRLSLFGLQFSFIDRDDYNDGSSSVAAAQVSDINIDWDAGEVNIEYGKNDKIIFSESNADNSDKMCWKLTDGKLNIASNKRGFQLFNFGSPNKTLTVTIPENKKFDELSVATASADIKSTKLSAAELNVSTVSGDVSIEEIKADDVDISGVSGNITADCEVSGEIEVESISGDTRISGSYAKGNFSCVSGITEAEVANKTDSVTFESVSGNIDIKLSKNADGFQLKRESVSGSFYTKLQGAMDGDTYVYGNGSTKIKAETVSGNISINKAE